MGKLDEDDIFLFILSPKKLKGGMSESDDVQKSPRPNRFEIGSLLKIGTFEYVTPVAPVPIPTL